MHKGLWALVICDKWLWDDYVTMRCQYIVGIICHSAAVLCCVVLCCVALRCVVLCCVVLCCVVLYVIMLLCYYVIMLLCYYVIMLLCYYVIMLLCDYVIMWLCDYVIMLLCYYVTNLRSDIFKIYLDRTYMSCSMPNELVVSSFWSYCTRPILKNNHHEYGKIRYH